MVDLDKEKQRLEQERKEKELYKRFMDEDRLRFERRDRTDKTKLDNLEREKLSIKEKIKEIMQDQNPDMKILEEYEEKLSFIEREIQDMERRFRD